MKYFYSKPRTVSCLRCGGNGGVNTRPKHGGDPLEDDNAYWVDCDHCYGGQVMAGPWLHRHLKWLPRLAGQRRIRSRKRCPNLVTHGVRHEWFKADGRPVITEIAMMVDRSVGLRFYRYDVPEKPVITELRLSEEAMQTFVPLLNFFLTHFDRFPLVDGKITYVEPEVK